jgi:hypothetical protein
VRGANDEILGDLTAEESVLLKRLLKDIRYGGRKPWHR